MAPCISKSSTACWRSWRLFLVRKLMLWWVSWGRCWKAIPTPSSTMPVARQLPSRLCQCGAKPARRAPTWDLSTLSGRGRRRSLARLLASLDWSWTGPSGASSKGRLLCHSPLRSKTEGLGAVFLDDITFALAGSQFFWSKVTDEPAILSACLMARTRFWRTFGSGPTTWLPSNGAVRTEERTWGWNLEVLQESISTQQLQVRRGRKACGHRGNLCFLNYGQLLPEKFRAFVLGRELFYHRCHYSRTPL